MSGLSVCNCMHKVWLFIIQVGLVSKSIECLSSALSQCLSKWRRLGSSQGKATTVSPLLQLVCCSTLQLAHSLSRLLQEMSILEKVRCTLSQVCIIIQGFPKLTKFCSHFTSADLKSWLQRLATQSSD